MPNQEPKKSTAENETDNSRSPGVTDRSLNSLDQSKEIKETKQTDRDQK